MDRKVIESKLQRTFGMSLERRAEIAEATKDLEWYTTCRVCRKIRKGTMAELSQPCGCEHGRDSQQES